MRADSPACHSGFGTEPGPIIQLRQHVIEGSPVAQHLFEQELRKNIEWVRKQLREIHSARATSSEALKGGSEAISSDHLAALARASRRHGLAYHLNVVLSKGWERDRFWSSQRTFRYYGPYGDGSYTLPTDSEIQKYISAIRRKALLLFTFERYGDQPVLTDRTSMLNSLKRSGLAGFCDALLHFPAAMFDETFWPRS